MKRAGIVILVMAALGLSLALPAFAQDGYPALPGVECTVTSVEAGGSVGVDGTNWLPDSTVALTFDATPVGTPETDAEGSFSTTVSIPSDATAGSHTITATGRDQNGDPATAQCALTVTAGAGPGIPVTGTNISLGLIILGAMIVAGLAFLMVSRRKKADVSS